MIAVIIILATLASIGIILIILRKKIADKNVRDYYSRYSEKEMGMSKEEYRKYTEKIYISKGVTYIIFFLFLLLLYIIVNLFRKWGRF